LSAALAESRKADAEVEARNQKPDDGSQMAESGSQQSKIGSQTAEARGQKPTAKAEPTEDAGEDAEVATASEPVVQNENAAPPAPDDEGYVWPEGTEAATEAAVENGAASEVVSAPLPSLDELVKRIPPAARETLDELFRARFVSVQRTSPSSLKN
jgi:hypothetical protein